MKLVTCYFLVAFAAVLGGHRNGIQALQCHAEHEAKLGDCFKMVKQQVGIQENSTKLLLAEIQEMKSKMRGMEAEIKKLSELSQAPSTSAVPETISSCKTAPKSGLYQLKLPDMPTPITVLCEMDTFGGGWTVVQQRLDKSVDFNRHFLAYRDGFGTVGPSTEFWLGLEALHQLTKNGTCELSVEMKGYKNRYYYARYADFGVGNEATQYTLNRLGSYSGTGGDGLIYGAKGGKFCTYDNDNTPYGGFAATQDGGWWYNKRFDSNLNGLSNPDNFGFYWSGTGSNLGYSRMMIRSAS